MKRFIAVIIVVGLFFSAGQSAITNVKFTDMKGNIWDLYTLLAEGKSVLVHCGGAT